MISNRCMIALAACVELAERAAPTTIPEIAEGTGVSASYMEQIFSQLKDAGIVKGIRGPGGGYVLADKARRISVLNVVLAAARERKRPEGTNEHPAITLLMHKIASVMAEIGLSDLTVPAQVAA